MAPLFGIDPLWFLAAFLASVAVFGRSTLSSRAPLYLSGPGVAPALAGLIGQDAAPRVLDAGCGIGTVLAALGRGHRGARLDGVECALGPWLVCRLRGLRVRWGDLWRADFGAYDVVYAFLSPAAMPRLWEKAQREMRPGSLLASYRFPIPGARPVHTLRLGSTGEMLYVWRL